MSEPVTTTPPVASAVPPTISTANTDGTFEVTIAGQVKTMTLDQLKQAASKAEGADEKFRAAASAVKTQELVKQMLTSPTGLEYDDAVVLARNVGGDPEDYMFELASTPDPVTPQTPVQIPAGYVPQQVQAQLSPEDQEDLAYAREQRMAGYVTKVKADIKNTLDKDGEIGKMIDKIPDGQKKDLQEVLSEMVYEEVSRRVGMSRQQYSPLLVQEVIQKVASRVNKLGLPTVGRQEINLRDLPISGLGPITGMSNSDFHSDKPIERIASNDAGYSDNFVARFAKKLAKALPNR